MAQVELILTQSVKNLGTLGSVVKVKPGYARNYLLPQKMAIRANAQNRARLESERAQWEAQNQKLREEAERLAERVGGLQVVLIRQAGESGSLYGSVTPRDIAAVASENGLTVSRQQVVLVHPIKTLGLVPVQVVLHPEVTLQITVNVARSNEEAERQARGERAQGPAEEEETVETDDLLEAGQDEQAEA